MEVITKMANTIRIKRRGSAGATGAPESLENAELAFNEADNTLYYGKGTGGAGGTATSVEAIGGVGAFVTRSTSQTISGDKTFSGVVIVPTPSANTHATTKAYVDGAVAGVATNFTVAGCYFIPHIQHELERAAGFKFFHEMDLTNTFHPGTIGRTYQQHAFGDYTLEPEAT